MREENDSIPDAKKRPGDDAGALNLNLFSAVSYFSASGSGQSSVRMTIGVERAFGSAWAQFW